MSEHGGGGHGGEGLIGNVLGNIPGPEKLVKDTLEHGGTDEALGILGAAFVVFNVPKLVDKIPDPFSPKKSGGGASKPAAGGGHGHGGH